MDNSRIGIAVPVLATGTIPLFILYILSIPPLPGVMTLFAGLAVMLISPTFEEAFAVGFTAGVLASLINSGSVCPAFILSEPAGAVVCMAVFLHFAPRPDLAPSLSILAATLVSGVIFFGINFALLPVSGIFGLVVMPDCGPSLPSLVLVMAGVNAIIAGIVYPRLRSAVPPD